MSRQSIAERICNLDGIHIEELNHGWPSHIRVQTSTGQTPVDLYAGPVSQLDRSRPDDYRLQNPGPNRPVRNRHGSLPVCLALWDGDQIPIIVACSASHWLNTDARVSAMFKFEVITSAQRLGWATYVNNDGERFDAFRSYLLVEYIEMLQLGMDPPTEQIRAVNQTTGVLDEDSEVSRERSRKATSALVRSAKFSKDVLSAYGERCAMCGLGLRLVSGAHIHPASAPGSLDVVTNGLCLCENHHRAFDRHLIWVNPITKELSLHTSLTVQVEDHRDLEFGRSTFRHLKLPNAEDQSPDPEMFRERYRYYEGQYDWSEA